MIGRLRLEAGAQLVQLDDRQVRVSPGEFRLLWRMAERAGETVSWNELHAALGESSDAVGERELVRTAIYRLRGKLEVDSASPALILTHRGRGYRLVA
ncbi:MAG TPA: winged helix-turn-helix domain-containing protein [Candidatus Luteococcus avicola]|nr:winged helix-turn-helix domain-containing protein [Candidatus Luteococcus avicola]